MDVLKLLEEAEEAYRAAGNIKLRGMDHTEQQAPLMKLYNMAERLIDALAEVVAQRDKTDRAFQTLKEQGSARDAELVRLKAKPSGSDRDALVTLLVEDGWEGYKGPLDLSDLGSIAQIIIAAGFSRPVGAE